jgi:biopolymer transport protein ExbD
MKISGKRGHIITLDSVAMTDIVMNMFIFFFISFSILYTFNPQHSKRLDVKLPPAQNASGIEDRTQSEITISAEGPVYLDGDIVSSSELKEKIIQKHSENQGMSVILRADKRVPFRNVVSVLDILSGVGITRVSIAAAAEQ